MTTLVVATRNAHKVAEIAAILGPGFVCQPLSVFREAPRLLEDGETLAANATKKALQLATWLAVRSGTSKAAGIEIVGTASDLETLGESGARDLESCFINGRSARSGNAGIRLHESGRRVLADDSGLEVDVLQGAPGVLSARFAACENGPEGNAPDAANNAKLLHLLSDVPPNRRTARFRCVLALVGGDRQPEPVCPLLFEGTCEGRIAFAPRGQGGFGYDPLFVPDGFEQSFAELGEEIKNGLSHRFRALEKLRRHLLGN